MPHAVEVITARPDRIGLLFATNNASRSPAQVSEQLVGLGLAAVPNQVVTSAEAGAALLAAQLDPGAVVLAVGGPGVRQALVQAGLTPTADAADATAVLQGYGADVTVRDLAEAAYAVAGGATWVATNRDATLPTDRGTAPGNGTLVAAVAVASGRQPVVAGKPEPPLYELCLTRLDLGAKDVLAVGDRLDTDIAGATAAGLDSLWVLTGVDSLESLVRSARDVRPTWVGEDLRVLDQPVPEVRRAGCWWICGDAQVRLDPSSPADLALGRGDQLGEMGDPVQRNALLAAGVEALLCARQHRDADPTSLTAAAANLNRAVFR